MAQKNYKDTVFRALFGHEDCKQNALDLYNAINGTKYTDPDVLQLNTLSNVIYMGVKNDVSFLIGDEMQLWEHQSSYNPNMPLRGLEYFTRLFSRYLKEHKLNQYGSKQIRLPTPVYIVFYNGTQDRPAKEILRLSEAFAVPEKSSIEVTVTVFNINYGKNRALMEQCTALKEYAALVAKIREYAKKFDQKTAVDLAITYCIQNGILQEFLALHRAEVKDMFLHTTYEEAMELFKQEGREEGREEGEDRFGRLIRRLLKEGKADVLLELTTDKEKRKDYYRRYGIE